MKINHFPNISLDISETKEKYLTEKNERIIEELCQVLVEHSKIESDIFLKHQEINTYKKENNLPTHQTIPGEMELFDEFKEKLTPLAQKHLTDNCYKRGFSASFGSPGTYDFVLEPCRVKFIMKSKAKMFLEFSYGNDFWYHKQFIIKLTESDWKIDKISYRYGSNDDSWHVSRF